MNKYLGYWIEINYNSGEQHQVVYKNYKELKRAWKKILEDNKKTNDISLMTAWFGKETQDNYEFENFLVNVYANKRPVKFTRRDIRDGNSGEGED